uniref:Immunoglobulin V-set domain-containing protein n=1 Tax=Eptatretus burgeri TaxID=7764 RepID=A0A8C4Q4I5_EPTBU
MDGVGHCGGFRDHVWVIEVRVGQVVRWCRKQTRNFSLMIHHVTAEDAGIYECKIKLESGKENVSNRFQVNVRTGKDDSKSSPSDQTQSSTCSPVSPRTNSSIKQDEHPYWIPFLCLTGLFSLCILIIMHFTYAVVQLKREISKMKAQSSSSNTGTGEHCKDPPSIPRTTPQTKHPENEIQYAALELKQTNPKRPPKTNKMPKTTIYASLN